MSKLLLGIAVLVLAARTSRAETLTIFTTGSIDATESMRSEVARLIAPAGFGIEWKSMSERRAGEDFSNLLVVRFQGACSSEVAPPPVASAVPVRSLASTTVTDGKVLPFATIHCDAMRAVMAPALNALPRAARPVSFARAVGRVLSHEVYHMVARSKTHSHVGASKACFGLSDLTTDKFSFDEASLAQMRPVAPRAVEAFEDEAEFFGAEPTGR